jgi:hypothetical protein
VKTEVVERGREEENSEEFTERGHWETTKILGWVLELKIWGEGRKYPRMVGGGSETDGFGTKGLL